MTDAAAGTGSQDPAKANASAIADPIHHQKKTSGRWPGCGRCVRRVYSLRGMGYPQRGLQGLCGLDQGLELPMQVDTLGLD